MCELVSGLSFLHLNTKYFPGKYDKHAPQSDLIHVKCRDDCLVTDTMYVLEIPNCFVHMQYYHFIIIVLIMCLKSFKVSIRITFNGYMILQFQDSPNSLTLPQTVGIWVCSTCCATINNSLINTSVPKTFPVFELFFLGLHFRPKIPF